MAFSNFIPEIWSARLLEHLDNVHVYASLMNRDYEGEIRAYGDTVHINQLGDITISDYTGADIADPEELDGSMQDLTIDKAKYFNFQVKDVDHAQSNPKLVDAAMQRASYGMNDVIDQYLASLLLEGADSGNILYDDSSAVTPTSADAYDYLVDLGVLLNEANVPMLGRWVVLPPWYHGLLLKDSRFVGNGTGYNQAILQGGLVGEAAGFQIHL
ncbi:MAG: P22 coat protein - protein 5 domain protein, partial [Clostridiales bacterium]|nr:P22 coat protein - protein 5 domain protein [Clostridiales bacterium]